MRATTTIAALTGLAALGACQKTDQPDQNIVITNTIPPGAEVEALPPDESSATSTDELANGATDPIVNADGNEAEAR